MEDRKKEVKKHVATIHCANTLSLLQRKISNALLYHAYHELLDKEEHEIGVKRLCTIIGYHGNNHAVIKDALKGMISTVIEWNVVDDKTQEEDWTASSVLASVHIKGSTCSYAYSPRMRALLHSPAVYGKINLIIQSRFKSNYGLALYENCVRYKGLSSTGWFELLMFRRLMGVPDGKYPIFRDFKRRVLDKAVEEINTYSDLIVEVELKRVGRKVSKLRFKLKERAKRQRIGQQQVRSPGKEKSFSEGQQALLRRLVNSFGLSAKQAEKLLTEYGEPFLREKLELVESSESYKKGKIRNLASYLLSALQENYQVNKSSQENAEALRRAQEVEVQQTRQTKQVEDEIKRKYHHYVMVEINKILAVMPTAGREQLLSGFVLHLRKQSDSFALAKYQSSGLEHIVVQNLFRHYLATEHTALLEDLLSYALFREELMSAKDTQIFA